MNVVPDIGLCITPACARRRRGAREARHGLRVCGRCADEMRDALVEIPDRWGDLDRPELIVPPVREQAARAPRGQAPGTPLNLTWSALVDARTRWVEPGDLIHPADALGGYRHRVLDTAAGRAVPYLVDGADLFHRGRGRGSGSVADICRAIAAHAELALRQEWAGHLCWAVRLVRDQLRALTGGPRPARPIGWCPELFDDGSWCGYPLWYPVAGDLECGGCGGVWPRRDWLRLADQQGVRTR
ncbi:hypothetical protein [Saccharothrix australiensis]|uniref:Uncharacterized protein n=1 Tax=Saccharothrix australiensis TaxID=2072 RepID=A0A495VNB5_9PSEU|nr:hypothetical protein [Saccharothrix australiensis]RKT49298.1 hypothetical protein C8E97_6794 [Saccharothrix australiensis]